MNRELLDLYMDYLICSTSFTTATGLSWLTGGAISHDKITRFLSSKDFSQSDLWQIIKPFVRSIEDEDGILIVDDSIEEKPYTKENDVIAWHYDHAKGKSVKGINFVSAFYNTAKASSPVGYALVKKTEDVINKKTNKKSRKSPISKQQMYRNLLTKAASNGVKFKYVVNDVWFSSAENMCFIKNVLAKDFVMPLKNNRKVALSEEKLAAGEFVKIKDLELGEGMLVWLKGVNFPVRLIRQVFKDEDGSTIVLHLVSSDIELTDDRIAAIYKRRWKVEEYHKSLKNNASLCKAPAKTIRTQSNHLFASICAFVRLERLSIASKLNHFALKGKIYMEALKTAVLALEKFKLQIFQTEKLIHAPA